MSPLETHLNACRLQTGMRLGVASTAVNMFLAGLHTDSGLRTEARLLEASTRDLEPRDHITRWQNGLIRRLLDEVEDV